MSTAAYLRVSTGQQSHDQQHDAVAGTGITPDRVFTDTASGRAGSNQPGWTKCAGWLREGDHLVVLAVDRLARGLAATKPLNLDVAQQKRLLRLYQQGEPVGELTTMFGISRSTLFRTLKILKQQPALA